MQSILFSRGHGEAPTLLLQLSISWWCVSLKWIVLKDVFIFRCLRPFSHLLVFENVSQEVKFSGCMLVCSRVHQGSQTTLCDCALWDIIWLCTVGHYLAASDNTCQSQKTYNGVLKLISVCTKVSCMS